MYIDPGAGSLILQILAAGLIAAAALFKQGRQAVKSFFKSLISRDRNP